MNGYQMQILLRLLDKIEAKVDKVVLNTTKQPPVSILEKLKLPMYLDNPEYPDYTVDNDELTKAEGAKTYTQPPENYKPEDDDTPDEYKPEDDEL